MASIKSMQRTADGCVISTEEKRSCCLQVAWEHLDLTARGLSHLADHATRQTEQLNKVLLAVCAVQETIRRGDCALPHEVRPALFSHQAGCARATVLAFVMEFLVMLQQSAHNTELNTRGLNAVRSCCQLLSSCINH